MLSWGSATNRTILYLPVMYWLWYGTVQTLMSESDKSDYGGIDCKNQLMGLEKLIFCVVFYFDM